MAEGAEAGKAVRTAGEAGWHASRYNLFAREPGTNRVIVANLYKGTCAACSPIETHLVSVVERLRENHPMIGPLARRGLIANFDERAALETMGRAVCAAPMEVRLTICPTMGCNFDCPYCFEGHRPGVMSHEVQDDVVALAGRMLEASGARALLVTWFGGEPLLAPGVIESLSGRLSDLARGRDLPQQVPEPLHLVEVARVDVLPQHNLEWEARAGDVSMVRPILRLHKILVNPPLVYGGRRQPIVEWHVHRIRFVSRRKHGLWGARVKTDNG